MTARTLWWGVAEAQRADATPAERVGVDGQRRLGQCWSTAQAYAARHPEAVVVQGMIRVAQAQSADGLGIALPHVWVEINGKVYDGTMGCFYDRADYYTRLHAVVTQRAPAPIGVAP